MKKFTAILLAVVMVFALGASAFAADTNDTLSSFTFTDFNLTVSVSTTNEGLTLSGSGRSATVAADTDRDIPQSFSLIFSNANGTNFDTSSVTVTTSNAATFAFYEDAEQEPGQPTRGYGIVALGFTFILLVGQLDISFGSVIALSACIFMMMLQAQMNFLLALLAAIAVGCACGAVTGFFVATFRLSPFIVSMTMQLAYKGIALTITNQTPVSVPHPVLQAINNIKLFNIFPIVFFFFLLLAVLTELFLRNTQFGRNLFLVGGNISVADNLGIKARSYIWSAYIFQGLFAAIGGVVMMTRQFSASGNLALQGPMEVIPMVIVGGTSMAGGRGGALKTVGGVVLLKIIYNAMTMFSIPAPLQPFVKGLILLVVIVSDKYMERRHEKV